MRRPRVQPEAVLGHGAVGIRAGRAVAMTEVDEDIGVLCRDLDLGPGGSRAVDLGDGGAVAAGLPGEGPGIADVVRRRRFDRTDHDHDLHRGGADGGWGDHQGGQRHDRRDEREHAARAVPMRRPLGAVLHHSQCRASSLPERRAWGTATVGLGRPWPGGIAGDRREPEAVSAIRACQRGGWRCSVVRVDAVGAGASMPSSAALSQTADRTASSER